MTEPFASSSPAWIQGMRDAMPLLGGYIPVAISFGLIATQANFSVWEATAISALIYAGASQFLMVAMLASGASLWLVVVMTLLINARHVVYAPNLTPLLPPGRSWIALMHGLTDQVFALAHHRLPAIPLVQRRGWYTGAAILAWSSWVLGTMLGAVAGAGLTQQWPLLGEVMPFALPALFLVLIAPRFTSALWIIVLMITITLALVLALLQFTNAAIPVAAASGALAYYALNALSTKRGNSHGS
ncbi:AzlC family ABC transporter permease [Alteromonas lipolytica]|uniref:Branched-chain amino acid permease n=1 Tax=Alteromonas lipolytica TaxID=1856405 RepID=A0A1E8FII8_9ALTE|nr:AzlC family ABC transporter permease [Alteromonas lipolytica]OFI35745.1 branched-chain amino acid permease [Alteromonas lipolytica]GGF80421.1 branched-chain amino acid transporter AzlC [Alteromonas lipolytica]